MRAWGWVVATGAFAALLAGCSCSGSTLGEPCTMDSDCDTGQVCDPATSVCWYPPGADSGPQPDGFVPGVDGFVPGVDGGPVPDGFVPGVDGGPMIVDGRVCMDADGDGVTDCAGDCDDSDPTTYPGAPEICGDGVANSCTGAADAGCGGLGTYVAPPPLGNNSNPGTQAMPVATINQGIMNAMTIGGGVDVYVAAGSYDENVTVVEGISLLGGYESAGWTRDPAANVSRIDSSTDAGLVFPHGITRMTSVEGFTIRARSGLSGSSAITIMSDSSPTVENNIIRAMNATSNSAAVHINPADVTHTGNPLLRRNDIYLAGAGTGWTGGNGSWGLRVRRTNVEIRANRVFLAEARTVQRGIELANCPNTTLVTGTSVRHPSGVADVTYGIRVASSGGTYELNDVWAGRCATLCVGMALEGGLQTVVVRNNVSFGGDAGSPGVTGGTAAGLWVAFEGVPTAPLDVLVHSNLFDGGAGSTALTAGVWMGERPTSPIIVGRYYNNIIRAGSGGRRFAVFENHPNIDYDHFENNALFASSSGSGSASLYFDEGLTAIGAISGVNMLSDAASNLDDDCNVIDATVDGDFHLMAPSNCIDAGNSMELPPEDYEGDARPAGADPDIGVDEV